MTSAPSPGVLQSEQYSDVGMVQSGQNLRFASEAGEPFRIAFERCGENLHRYVAIKPGVTCAIHLTHTAASERPGHLIRPDAIKRSEGH
jgi:hypothetical protein